MLLSVNEKRKLLSHISYNVAVRAVEYNFLKLFSILKEFVT